MIFLREISKDDIKTINKWRNNKNLIDFLGSPFRFVNVETEEEWFNAYMRNRSNAVRLAICLIGSSEMVGVIYLTNIDWLNKSAEYSIMIGDEANYGKGYALVATQMMITHAFSNLNLYRIWLTVLEDNERAISLYKKVGFKQEGIMRSVIYKCGVYKNMLLMSVLKDEYKV